MTRQLIALAAVVLAGCDTHNGAFANCADGSTLHHVDGQTFLIRKDESYLLLADDARLADFCPGARRPA